MKHEHIGRQKIIAGLAVSLGLVFTLSLLAGLALAQGPSDREAGVPGVGGSASILATGSITGRVTYADGTPVAAGTVMVEVYDGVSQEHLGGVSVGADGYYSVTVTAPYGKVRIVFWYMGGGGTVQINAASEWYNDAAFFSTADAIDISAGGITTGVDVSLEQRGAITGTVKLGGSTPVVGAHVMVYNAYKSPVSGGSTDANGRYTVTVPYPGTHAYLVEFGGDSIAREWYRDEDSLEAATPVTVSAGTTVTVDADVTAAGWITGVVTDANTALAIPWAWIEVYDQAGNYFLGTGTDSSGVYRVGGLGTGYYKVRFREMGYVGEYYDDKSTLDQATPVSVTAGITTPNISAALTPETPPIVTIGVVTGTVTKNGGNPLGSGDWVNVFLYDATTSQIDASSGVGGSDSTYTAYVAPGTYKVLFWSTAGLAPEWYSDTTSMASATVVTVTAGMTTTNVNADLGPATGCMSGVVTADGAGVIPDAEVDIHYAGAPEGDPWAQMLTDPSGVYQQCGLKGDYRVRFEKFPYIPEWYDGATARTDATTVTVTNGVTRTVNATMTLGGCVSGKVTDIRGQPQAGGPGSGVLGRVYDPAGSRAEFYGNGAPFLDTSFHPAEDGSFVLCGFPTGHFTIWCGMGTNEALQGRVPVTLTAGQETSGVTCVLARRLYLPMLMRSSSL